RHATMRSVHRPVEAARMSFLYEVRVRGRLSPTLASEFEQLALTANVAPVETVLSGPIEDQAALHGLLRRIESLGLELLEVRRFPADPPTTGGTASGTTGNVTGGATGGTTAGTTGGMASDDRWER
ncbi:MAG TPA: hypothetical protein VFI47_30605, partial [Acidimicrobiales bacterium]|nr:hypothetical protein [Acidimicrobiales bacterium]